MPTDPSTYFCRECFPDSASAAKVSASSPVRAATHVDGPTLYTREPAFGRGLASADRAPTCLCRSNGAYVAHRSSPIFRVLRAPGAFCALLLLALTLAGCGGGGAEAPAADAAAGTTPTTPDPTAATTGAPADGSAQLAGNTTSAAPSTGSTTAPTVNPGDDVRTSDATPSRFVAALGKYPIIVVLAQPKSELDNLVYAEAKTAAAGAKGSKVVLFAVAAGDYQTYGDVPEIVGLYAAPGVVVIDRSGKVQNQWVGYVDHGIIGEALARAARAKKASVSNSDAPPVPTDPLTATANDAASVDPTTGASTTPAAPTSTTTGAGEA